MISIHAKNIKTRPDTGFQASGGGRQVQRPARPPELYRDDGDPPSGSPLGSRPHFFSAASSATFRSGSRIPSRERTISCPLSPRPSRLAMWNASVLTFHPPTRNRLGVVTPCARPSNAHLLSPPLGAGVVVILQRCERGGSPAPPLSARASEPATHTVERRNNIFCKEQTRLCLPGFEWFFLISVASFISQSNHTRHSQE